MVLAQAADSGYLHSSSPLQIECDYDDEMCEDIYNIHDFVPSYYSWRTKIIIITSRIPNNKEPSKLSDHNNNILLQSYYY